MSRATRPLPLVPGSVRNRRPDPLVRSLEVNFHFRLDLSTVGAVVNMQTEPARSRDTLGHPAGAVSISIVHPMPAADPLIHYGCDGGPS